MSEMFTVNIVGNIPFAKRGTPDAANLHKKHLVISQQ